VVLENRKNRMVRKFPLFGVPGTEFLQIPVSLHMIDVRLRDAS
jgi:hypothetical protein